MKAVFVDGPAHGWTSEMESIQNALYIPVHADSPNVWINDSGNYAEPLAKQVVYLPHGCFPNELQPDVVVYWCTTSRRSQEVQRLLFVMAKHGAIVGLNVWLDLLMESQLVDDLSLQRHLFVERTPFEFAVAEIEGRNTAARLKRRFCGF